MSITAPWASWNAAMQLLLIRRMKHHWVQNATLWTNCPCLNLQYLYEGKLIMYACIIQETFVFTVFRRVVSFDFETWIMSTCMSTSRSNYTDMSIWKKHADHSTSTYIKATFLLTRRVTNQCMVSLHVSATSTCTCRKYVSQLHPSNQCCCRMVQSCMITKNCKWIVQQRWSANLFAWCVWCIFKERWLALLNWHRIPMSLWCILEARQVVDLEFGESAYHPALWVCALALGFWLCCFKAYQSHVQCNALQKVYITCGCVPAMPYRELSICTMHGFCDSKTSNVASSPLRLSDLSRVVELEGPTDDKFDACAHEWNWHSNRPRIIRCANRKLPIITM